MTYTKEQRKTYNQNYYAKNKQQTLENKKITNVCTGCGRTVQKYYMKNHLVSDIHWRNLIKVIDKIEKNIDDDGDVDKVLDINYGDIGEPDIVKE